MLGIEMAGKQAYMLELLLTRPTSVVTGHCRTARGFRYLTW